MEATEYMYSGLPIGSVGRLSNHPDFVRILPILLANPESQPICDRDKNIPILKSVLIIISKMNSCDTYTRTHIRVYLMKTDTTENFKNCTKSK